MMNVKQGYDVKLIANEFLRLARTEERELTNLQLQKLVYIAHGYHLAIYDKPLFSQDVMAWNFGPVIIDLYNNLKIYGRGVVEKDLRIEHVENSKIESDSKNLIKVVFDKYKHLKASQLVTITHERNTPWKKAWDKEKYCIIDRRIIKEYYRSIVDE